jgi:hypothetical protein
VPRSPGALRRGGPAATSETSDRPLQAGLLQQAEAIRRRIRNSNHPSHLYAGMLHTEVRLALEVARSYQAKGADVQAAVREMRRAFDEPTPYPRPAFAAVDLIDRWLAKHGR